MPQRHYLVALWSACLGLAPLACQEEAPVVQPGAHAPAAKAKKEPVDRLKPGELAAGKHRAFGFVAPRGLALDATFRDSAHFSGTVEPLTLASYVKERISVSHAEVTPTRTTFERARILGGDPKRLFQIDILKDNATKTRLVVRDVTPPPPVLGLSDAERWRRVGMKPNGELLDPLKTE